MNEMTESDFVEFISQPLDGLLYDLELMPEQVNHGSREWLYSEVIKSLYLKAEKK